MTLARRITNDLEGRWYGSYGLARCPAHDDRSPSLKIVDDKRKVDGIDLHCFASCGWRDVKAELRRQGLLDAEYRNHRAMARTKGTIPENQHYDRLYAERQLAKAKKLWSQAETVNDTPLESYLRKARRYSGPIPASIRYSRPTRPGHHPAMIAVFALYDEPEPGVISIRDDQMRGAHLTFLKADGSGKAGTERDKIMIGRSSGLPIVLSPINDTLGLVISKG
jgi:hypothetical protein